MIELLFLTLTMIIKCSKLYKLITVEKIKMLIQ